MLQMTQSLVLKSKSPNGAHIFPGCVILYALHHVPKTNLKTGPQAPVIRDLKSGTEEVWFGYQVGGWWRGDGRVWDCVKAMISADHTTLLLIGTVKTLGCLPPHSNEKPWPLLVSKVTKAYCNCTFSNGVSHVRTQTPVMTITIMSLGSTGALRPSVTLRAMMLLNYC